MYPCFQDFRCIPAFPFDSPTQSGTYISDVFLLFPLICPHKVVQYVLLSKVVQYVPLCMGRSKGKEYVPLCVGKSKGKEYVPPCVGRSKGKAGIHLKYMYHFAWADQRKSRAENRDTFEMYPRKVMHIIGG